MRLYHFMKQEHGLSAIKTRKLRISRLRELNDPFELLSADLSNKQQREALTNFKNQLDNKKGLLCFCRSWHHPILWAHYAESHSGLCLGFDIPDYLPTNVHYVASRLAWPNIIDEAFVQRLLLTKFVHWSYEDECRIYTDLDIADNGNYFADFSDRLTLKQVIVGAKSNLTRMDLSAAVGRLMNIEIFKARAAFRTFRIVRNKNEFLWT